MKGIANEIGASLTKLREHFKKELTGKDIGPSVEMNPINSLVNRKLEVEISTEEVTNAIRFMKGGKTAGEEIWGRKPTDDVYKPARMFFKYLYGLPANTPKYFLLTELGIEDAETRAKRRNLEYIRKVKRMDSDRFPKIILSILRDTDEFILNRLESIKRLRQVGELNQIRRARGLAGVGGARLLYQTLEDGKTNRRHYNNPLKY